LEYPDIDDGLICILNVMQKGKEYEGWARTIYHQNPDTSYPVAQILVEFKQVVMKTEKQKPVIHW
jgi:hypothetical protein